MFNLFQNKRIKPAESRQEEEAAAKKLLEEIDKKIEFHVMPKNFLSEDLKADQAKQAGILIVVSGVIFLLIVLFLFYWFIFKLPAKNIEAPQNQEKATSTSSEENIQKQEQPKDLISKKADNKTGSSSKEAATTTPIIASSTPEVSSSTPEEKMEVASSSEKEISEENANIDSDSDGLSNKEEILFGTNPNNKDSDGDGYLDGEEVLNLYNPAGPGKLEKNSNIKKYQNVNYDYNCLYPLGWVKSKMGGEDSIIFKSSDNYFVQIIVEPNPEMKNIENWYQEQFGKEAGPELKISGAGWRGIRKANEPVVYLSDNKYNYIYTISYTPGSNGDDLYNNVFELIIKSFKIGL